MAAGAKHYSNPANALTSSTKKETVFAEEKLLFGKLALKPFHYTQLELHNLNT